LTPGRIKATGRLYGAQVNNIHYWAKTLQASNKEKISPATVKKQRSRLTLNPEKSAKHHDKKN
jgi:hypothetical protein